MTRRFVTVTYLVEVEMDDSKFDTEFMNEFSENFFDIETLEGHAEHIADLAVREMLDHQFTEGYGPLNIMGIKALVNLESSEVQDTAS